MRLSTVCLLALAALAYAQDAAVVEEEAADTDTTEQQLDLDEIMLADEPVSADTAAEDEADTVPIDEPPTESVGDATASATASVAAGNSESATTAAAAAEEENAEPEQSGPFIDLFGAHLYSLEMIDETQAQLVPQYTNEALRGKKVVGVYFSADWCGPCRKFTPELVAFYEKMNARRGHKDDFEIIWVSRCRDMESFGQYFTHMKWLALPPEEAMGQRGQYLSNKYKVKGIPSLVLLDDLGNLITTDARNKIPQDKAGIGFPWRNPLVTLYTTIFPRSLRLMVKVQVDAVKGRLLQRVKGLIGMNKQAS